MIRLVIELGLMLIIQILMHFQEKKKDILHNSMTTDVKLSLKHFTFHYEKTKSKLSINITIY